MITPLDCQDLVELITDYLEGALPASEQREFEEHLRDCDKEVPERYHLHLLALTILRPIIERFKQQYSVRSRIANLGF